MVTWTVQGVRMRYNVLVGIIVLTLETEHGSRTARFVIYKTFHIFWFKDIVIHSGTRPAAR